MVEGTGRLGAFRAARRASSSFSEGMDSEKEVKSLQWLLPKRKYTISIILNLLMKIYLVSLLGAVSSFSFWSRSAIAWSSLLRPLVGRWPALLFLLTPCVGACVDCACCLASSAATRLRKKHELYISGNCSVDTGTFSKCNHILTFCNFQEETILQHCWEILHLKGNK